MTSVRSELQKARRFAPEGAFVSAVTNSEPTSIEEEIAYLRAEDHPLSDARIAKFWGDAEIGGIIQKMDGSDYWAVDAAASTGAPLPPDIEIKLRKTLKTLATAIFSAQQENHDRLRSAEISVARFLGHLKSSRALAIFRLLAEYAPDVAISLMQQAAEEEADVFLVNLHDRVRVLERTRILSRIFSPDRVAVLLEVLGDQDTSASVLD